MFLRDKYLPSISLLSSGEVRVAAWSTTYWAKLQFLASFVFFSAQFIALTLAQDKSAANASPTPYDWSGFYIGGHMGYAFGSSKTSAPALSGSLSLDQRVDNFDESGNIITGLQGGYNYLLPNRFLIGVETDVSFPGYSNLQGISIGGTRTFTSPTFGPETHSDTVDAFGTVRLRIGYAPGNWLFYATGGLAWLEDRQLLTVAAAGATQSPNQWRLGWTAGAGVEIPIIPHWTARLEYLFIDYGSSTQSFGRESLAG